MQTYEEKIISGLESISPKQEEQRLDYVVEQLKNVPEEMHEEVMWRCAAYMTLSKSTQVTDWFGETEAAEAEADMRFVEMSERDWRDSQTTAKRQKWFSAWNDWVVWARRIDNKRFQKAVARRTVKREIDKVGQLLVERLDVIRNPHYFGSQEDADCVLAQIVDTIKSIPTGKWRLELVLKNERIAIQSDIDEFLRKLKLTEKIRELVEDGGGNQPVRRTHDDGFADDYDGEDECEESDSQAAERRQEMAEERERQAEIYGECCDGICCECDHGQYARPPTGRWEDQVDPRGRTFSQAWKEFGAGIARENARQAE